MPGGVAGRDRGGDLGAGRVEQPDQAEQGQPGPLGVRRGRGRLGAGPVPTGDGQHAQPVARSSRRPRRRAPAAAPASSRAARQQRLRCALDVHPQPAADAVEGGHRPAARVEREQRDPVASRGDGIEPSAGGSGHVEQRQLGRVAGAGDGVGGGAAGDGIGEVAPAAARATAPPASRTCCTCITFAVRVPVLSVQITGSIRGSPTAESRLTSAPRRAIARTPAASARVIVGSRPSGHVRHEQPDGEHERLGPAQPGRDAERQERDPDGDRDGGDQVGDPADLAFQRAVARPAAARASAAIRPISVCAPVRVDDRLGGADRRTRCR